MSIEVAIIGYITGLLLMGVGLTFTIIKRVKFNLIKSLFENGEISKETYLKYLKKLN